MKNVHKAWDSYLSLWKNLEGRRLFIFYSLHYIFLFILLSQLVFRAFYVDDRTFIYNSDGMRSYLPRLIYLSKTIRNGIQSLLNGEGWSFPLWDFHSVPIRTDLAIEPLQLLAVLCPWDQCDVLYDALTLTRFCMVGLSFSIFGFYFKQKPIPVLIGAISYTFCGYILFAGSYHPHFCAPLIYLPFLIIGVEKVFRKENLLFLTIIVFLCVTTSVFFSCILAVLIVIYVLVRFFTDPEYKAIGFGRIMGRFILSGGIGLALSGVILLPSLINNLNTGRIGNDIASYTNFLHYNLDYYKELVQSFTVLPNHIGSVWTFLGFSVLTLPAVVLLFVRPKKENLSLRVLFLILTGMLLFPAVAYALSGFNAISNRWCFAYALCSIAILMFELPAFFEVGQKKLSFLGIWLVSIFLFCYLNRKQYQKEPFVLLCVSLILLGLCWVMWKGNKERIFIVALGITCVSVCVSSYLLYDTSAGNVASEFIKKGNAYPYYEQSQYGSFSKSDPWKEDNDFYRVVGDNLSDSSSNMAFYYDINGLSFHSSYDYNSYRSIDIDLETSHRVYNLLSYGYIDRANLLSLLNVKYYIQRETKKSIQPYGFEEVDRVKNDKSIDVVLENKYVLPIGYTYSNYLLQTDYNSLVAPEKQECLLKSVILDNDSALISKAEDVKITTKKIPITTVEEKDLVWENGVLSVQKENATITLTYEGVPNSETYLRVKNLNLNNGASGRRWDLKVETDRTLNRAKFTADGSLYSNHMKTQIISLGYSDEKKTTCTLTFPQKGTFILDDLEIWCQPMDNYAEQIRALRAEPLENVETNWRGLTGTISVSKDKFLCFSIPYDKGWTAYVDGEKANLVQANIGFMGVELEAGDHEIELKYWPPGLTAGIVLSCVGLVGAICLFVYMRKSKRKGMAKQ